jgi:2-iminobutanoate/2-iminopropanoate deaminase
MIERLGGSPTLASGERIPLSNAVRAGDLLFISGQLGLDDQGRLAATDVAGQVRQIALRLERLLALAGVGFDAVVKTTVWLTDPTDFPAFNAAYREHFGAHPPARSTVVSALLVPGARVEIEAVAHLARR